MYRAPRLDRAALTPTLRLVGRAITAFLLSFLTQLQAAESWDSSLLRAAVVGGVLAAIEVGTPLNSTVGLGKP